MAGAVRSVCPVGATLGEGPVWIARDQALWFVDIKQRRLHRFDPATAGLDSWDAPAQPGWVLPAADQGLICGLQTGLHRFSPETGAFSLIAAVEPALPGNRLNDATVDAQGRLWFGSMDDGESEPCGHFYRADKDGICRVAGDIAITNGPAVSPDATHLYHVDTLGGIVHVSRIAGDGSLTDTQVFARIDPADGHPDGPSVDADGCVWIGLWGGWSARRYAPSGALIETVRFPVANVTKVAFGGDDLRTAFATTAAKGLTDAARAAQPLAGNLFAFDCDVPGLPVAGIGPIGASRPAG